jgi:aminoglycoside 3-N-acetyltransferase
MFIGATLYSNTFLHGIEEWLPVPGMLTETPQNLIIESADGRRIPRTMRRHLGQHSRWYGILEETFRKSRVDHVSIRTDQDYVKGLMNLFAQRC